jgi:hypothetical protein
MISMCPAQSHMANHCTDMCNVLRLCPIDGRCCHGAPQADQKFGGGRLLVLTGGASVAISDSVFQGAKQSGDGKLHISVRLLSTPQLGGHLLPYFPCFQTST